MSEQEFSFSSLMDLAATDTSDLSAQTSRLQRAGIYIIDLNKLQFSEQAPADPADPVSYLLNIAGQILAFSPLDLTQGDGTDLIGRDLPERYFLNGKQVKEAIQLLMGRFKTVGFKHKGQMGGVEGMAGWVDEALGKRVAVRVRHYTSKDGQERVGFDWLSPKQMEKAELPWETLARPFLDEQGNEVELAA
jgi:hypothetical protein